MRQIRFRVWNPSAKTMLYPDSADGSAALTLDGRVFIGDWSAWDFEIDLPYSASRPLTPEPVLMLSTGLRDKNGREIFEGDVVRNEDGRPYLVEWHDTPLRLGFDLTVLDSGGMPPYRIFWSEWIVIGNRYETAELASFLP